MAIFTLKLIDLIIPEIEFLLGIFYYYTNYLFESALMPIKLKHYPYFKMSSLFR
ncbi:hypothetical protein RV17_GL002425 [Enterococcus thailandicus]|nr:hypothetical protein RV17_GL002425 [Enterococcus thailandicus]